MRSVAAVLLLASLALAAPSFDSFRQWAKTHGKVYTSNEEVYRYAIFKENLAIIERLNMENHGATFGANKFSDLTNAEFKSMHTTKLMTKAARENFAVIADTADDELDMKSYLPPVKDQAQCGSCWAFSAVANMEGQYYLKNNQVISLSEQQLVSCDKTDSGCDGGLMENADKYAVKNGMATEAAYPYVSGTGSVPSCKAFKAETTFASYKAFGQISSDDTIISYLKTYGPLSVAIEADQSVFQSYKSGVLDSYMCGTTLDHGVTLVGYGTDKTTGKAFWTIRNSWGSTWGEAGYIRMARGKNMCGINSELSTIVA